MHKAIHLQVPGHWDLRSIVIRGWIFSQFKKRLGIFGGERKSQAATPSWPGDQSTGAPPRPHPPTQSHRGWTCFGPITRVDKGIQGLIFDDFRTYGILFSGRLFLGWVGWPGAIDVRRHGTQMFLGFPPGQSSWSAWGLLHGGYVCALNCSREGLLKNPLLIIIWRIYYKSLSWIKATTWEIPKEKSPFWGDFCWARLYII